MFQVVKKKLKDQKGLTLIELLAVIVILAIIAAIAIPSILSIIDNSKKDAQASNAQQMVAAARTAVAQGDTTNVTWNSSGTTGTSTITQLKAGGYLEAITNPDDKQKYNESNSLVTITKSGTNYSYTVTLIGASKTYFSNIPSDQLDRNHVATN